MTNVLNFGGGGFVGTAYMLGSLLALDQVLVLPELGVSEKRSFFDYAERAGVPFGQLEFRVDDVLAEMPQSVLSGEQDTVSRAFSVAQGISGGSLLAWSMLSDAPLVHLVRTMFEFDARVYLKPNFDEFKEFLQRLPSVALSLGNVAGSALRDLLTTPVPADKQQFFFRCASKLLFDAGRVVKDSLPSGLCTGDGLEQYVDSLIARSGGRLPVFFDDVRRKGKHLIIIAERMDYVELISEGRDLHESEVYFGIGPYDKEPIARAIRASCSLPIILAPTSFFDPVLKRYVQLLDGGIAKTVGFRKISELVKTEYDEDVGLWVVFNPIVPQETRINNPVDIAEQVVKKFVYNRKCALWDELDDKTKSRTVLFEADKDFNKSLMAWPDMKRALWHGYWHGLEQLSGSYEDVSHKLSRVGLALSPPHLLRKYIETNNDRKERYL